VTGIVVANRTGTNESKVAAPSASPSTTVNPQVAQAPTAPAPAPRRRRRSRRAACRRSPSSPVQPRGRRPGRTREDTNDKVVNAAKDAASVRWAPRPSGRWAAPSPARQGAGKGALIGGGVGAGAGTLYGLYDNKKTDERISRRTATA